MRQMLIAWYNTVKGGVDMPTEKIIRNVVHNLKSTYALRTVSIFGSYAEGRATASSDLDLLVEFDHPTVSLIKLNALKYDLEDALGLPVIQPGKVVRVL